MRRAVPLRRSIAEVFGVCSPVAPGHGERTAWSHAHNEYRLRPHADLPDVSRFAHGPASEECGSARRESARSSPDEGGDRLARKSPGINWHNWLPHRGTNPTHAEGQGAWPKLPATPGR